MIIFYRNSSYRLLSCRRILVSQLYREVHSNPHTSSPNMEHQVSSKVFGAVTALQKFKDQIGIYSELSKSKLSALVVLSTGAGFLFAGTPIVWSSFAAVAVGTSLAACSANTFNQIWEIENDKLMNRTLKRPLPSGRITKQHAMGVGVITALTSTGILAVGCNPLTAALGALNIGLYAGVYTPLKTRSEWNTWVGSIVGAIPPVMGYIAANGNIFSMEALILSSTLYLWQFPHFFALSWRVRKDYARGGFKMVPCRDPTGSRTASIVQRHSLYLSTIPFISTAAGLTSMAFCLEGAVINAYVCYLAHRFSKNPNNETATKVFQCSLWYLPVILGGLVFHRTKKKNPEDQCEEKNARIETLNYPSLEVN